MLQQVRGITGSLDLESIVAAGSGWKSSVTVTLNDRKKELKNGTYTPALKKERTVWTLTPPS